MITTETAIGIASFLVRDTVDPDALTASIGGTLPQEIMRRFPGAADEPATVRGAIRYLGSGRRSLGPRSNFLLTVADAKIHGTKAPTYDVEHRLLLGDLTRRETLRFLRGVSPMMHTETSRPTNTAGANRPTGATSTPRSSSSAITAGAGGPPPHDTAAAALRRPWWREPQARVPSGPGW